MTGTTGGHARNGREFADGPRPFLKWAGGKFSIAPELTALLPFDLERRTYREPFLGGGGLFFYLSKERPPKRAILSDALADLIRTYEAVKRAPRKLNAMLSELAEQHDRAQFYDVRARFNSERAAADTNRAAWLIYLNKTCYNGLFRTNKTGDFNVPMGRFENPAIYDPARIVAASEALAGVTLLHARFEHLLQTAKKGDVIYFDPPYVPVSKTANFAAYSDGAFGPSDQKHLADVFRQLDARGCLLALSNSDTEEVRRLYAGFSFSTLVAPRNISARGATRRPIKEVVVRNLERYPTR